MYVGGLDIGTTGCKIAIYDETATLIDTYYREYHVKREQGLHEIDMHEVWDAVCALLRQTEKYPQLGALGVTSFGETFVMLDSQDEILAPSMLYTDPRGQEENTLLASKLGEEYIALKTGVQPHCMYTLPKLLWMKQHKPEIYERTKRVLLVQDFIVYQLSGTAQIDYSLASRTMAFDIQKKCWDTGILDCAGISSSLFSTPVPSGTVAGIVKQSLAEQLGISKQLKIISCCHDQIAAATGAGIFQPGMAMDGIGTVECIPVILDQPPQNAAFYKYGYSVAPHINGTYACYIISFAGGSTLKWFRDTFAQEAYRKAEEEGENIFALLDKTVPKEPTSLLVMPHFTGAATPFMNADAKAAVLGLTFEHTKQDLYKALMEGTTYEMLLNLDMLHTYGIDVRGLRATGGGANSDVWLQIKADILNLPITALDCKEVGAAGTALVAGNAVGLYDDLPGIAAKMAPERRNFLPDMERHELYQQQYVKYKKIYQATQAVEV